MLTCALALPSAAAAAGRPADDGLSPRLAELASPAVRSASPTKQAEELGLAAQGAGSLLREGNRVLVEVRFDSGAATGVDGLRAAGAKVVDVSPRYQTVTAAVDPADLRDLSSQPRVAAVTAVLTPVTAASTCPSGVAVSEGVKQLHAGDGAGEARNAFGVDGSGVSVGILSDSFDHATKAADESGPVATHASEDAASGDLPGVGNTCGHVVPVTPLDDSAAGGEDEGRAMIQIVHDLAPGAHLSFATAFTGLTAFAKNIKKLAMAGAGVIADDVFYFEEPFFQEGPVGVAVEEVTEGGVSYFSSAGNNNLINGGRDIASWEAPQYRDSGGCPTALVGFSEALEGAGEPGLHPDHCMDFNPGAGVDRTFRITVSSGVTLNADLQWAEPWLGVGDDIDAYLLGPEGAVVTDSIEDNVHGSQRPFELIGWKNETGAAANVKLVVNRYDGVNDPPLKLALLQNGGGVTSTEYESSLGGDVVGPTIFGHNGAEDVTSVGAIRYSTTTAPEKYSSRGPVTHYFGPVNGVSAAAPLPAAQVIPKPDLTATDCGATTFFASFFGGEGKWRFCGTSAAAPHAAAVAALMLQKEPGATPQEIRTALAEGAAPIGAFDPCAVGAGLLDAVAAIERLLVPGPGPGPGCAQPSSEPGEPSEEAEPLPSAIEAEEQIREANPAAEVEGPQAPPAEPPHTLLLRHPRQLIRTRHRTARAVFRFGANEGDVTFVCGVDGGPPRPCASVFSRRFRAGAHVLRVTALDAAGSADPTPAVFRFRVKRVG
jgi:Subtilase family